LKGIIVAGPGPIKYDFLKGDYLHYQLKDKVISTIDSAYVGKQGVKEVVEKAPEIMRQVRYVEERRLVQSFLYQVGHDTGLATYGEEEVRRALKMGAVETILVSEDLEIVDTFVELAKQYGTIVEIISRDTREGEQLYQLGGIAAILRWKIS